MFHPLTGDQRPIGWPADGVKVPPITFHAWIGFDFRVMMVGFGVGSAGKLVEEEKRPKHTTCIKRTANYTLACPDETLYVYGCNGVKYKNACMAERDGIYNYSTDNGVITNDDG